MSPRIVWTIMCKEALDTLRDRRTLIMMVALPALLYPAMMMVGLQAVLMQQQHMDALAARVAFDTPDSAFFRQWMAGGHRLQFIAAANPMELLAAGEADVVLATGAAGMHALQSDHTLMVRLYYDRTEFRSNEAVARVAAALQPLIRHYEAERLARISIRREFIRPVEVQRMDIASTKKITGSILGIVLPMLMVIMITFGAFYPAVDITAGEKERGTFETLLSTPASRMEIVTGKYLTVFALAMATGLLNLVSMSGSLFFLFRQLPSLPAGAALTHLYVPYHLFPLAVLIMAPLALFVSAVLMSVAVFTRSFKEAQNYSMPVFLLLTLPATLAALPGISLNPATQCIPIINVALLFREMLTGDPSVQSIFMVFLSTAVFAVLALLTAVWLFQREEVVLAETPAFPVSLRRSDFTPTDAPGLGLAMAGLAVVMILIFYLGAWMQQRDLLYGILATEVLLILAPPAFIVWFARINAVNTFLLRPCGVLQVVAAVLMAGAALIVSLHLGLWQQQVLPLPPAFQQEIAHVFRRAVTPGGTLLLLLSLAVVPAVCEEMLFRGWLLTSLRQRMSPAAAMLVTALLFGVFHLSIHRLLVTALLGLLLAYVTLRSRSIVPAVFIHFLNNTTAVILGLGLVPDFVRQWVLYDSRLPLWTLAVAAALLLMGAVLLEQRRSAEGRSE